MTKVYRVGEKGLETAHIEIDGKKYDLTSMTVEQATQVRALEEIDAHMKFLALKLGVSQTARNVHLEVLKRELSKVH